MSDEYVKWLEDMLLITEPVEITCDVLSGVDGVCENVCKYDAPQRECLQRAFERFKENKYEQVD